MHVMFVAVPCFASVFDKYILGVIFALERFRYMFSYVCVKMLVMLSRSK